MNNRVDRGLQLRAQEIVQTSKEPVTVNAAVSQALRERFGDDIDALREAAAASIASTLRGLRKASYELPEDEGQLALYDIPPVIVVSTPDGDLAVPKDRAELGHVRTWQREGQQHHSVQLSRFKRFGRDLEVVADHDDDISWPSEALPVLAERKRKELEGAE